ELFAAGRRQRIVPSPPVVLGRAPFSLDPALEQQSLQGGIEGAFANLEYLLGDVLEVLRDTVPVLTACEQRLEDQQIQGAWEEFRRVFSHRLTMGACVRSGGVSSGSWFQCAAGFSAAGFNGEPVEIEMDVVVNFARG